MENDKVSSIENVFLLSLWNEELIRSIQAPFPVTPTQIRTLLAARQNPGINMSRLAHKLNVSKPNLTPSVNHLVKNGCLQRELDLSDRRVMHLKLTQAGLDLLSNVSDQLSSSLCEKVSHLRPREKNEFIKSLNKVLSFLDKLSD
ncbi:MAG: MarR family winged helix-turn-helix transcriptional regulator [Christensenellales bacterium]